MLRKTVTACLFLFVSGVFVVTSSGPVMHRIIEEEVTSGDIDLRRFILTENAYEKWISWQQHVACLTTCVQGYESETVGCCTTGDNRLCFGLPWKVLNNSIGSCSGFCDRAGQISCKFAPSAVCGSDGKMYENSCEFAKARCVDKLLIQKDIKFCNNHRVTSSSSQRLTGYTSPLSMTKVSTTSMLSSTIATKSVLSTLALASTMHTDSTTKSTVSSIAQTKSTVSSNALTKSSVSSNAPTTPIMSSYVTNSAVITNATTSPVYTNATSATPTNAITSTAQTTNALTPPSYCQNKHSISCGFTFKIVCGSDGKIYANLCMLALGRCDNPYLTQKDC